jgi:hypothetical protein
MIQLTRANGKVEIVAATSGFGVYLDNDSLIDLAKGSASRRKRFVDALQGKGTLLFSWANAVEVAGPQGRSADAVRSFLDSIGPHWVPLELNPWEVIRREEVGLTAEAVVSTSFMEAFFKERSRDLSQGRAADVFFRLGTVVDWVQEQRDDIRARAEQIDDEFRKLLEALRANFEKDATSMERLLPPCQFDGRYPATFVLRHLQRLLISEAKAYQFKSHDGLDLCHATLAAAYGSLITLDSQWKRRVQALPESEKLARTYYRPEIDDLITMMEALVSRRDTQCQSC